MAFVKLMYNVPLSPSYKNVIRFENVSARPIYFASIDANFANINYYTEVNFDMGDSVNTKLVLEVPSTSEKETLEMLSANYMHVVLGNFFVGGTELFYFITKTQTVNRTVIEFTLELDVMTTYLHGASFPLNQEIFTERKHCQRIQNAGTNLYNIDGREAILPDDMDGLFTASVPSTNITQHNILYDTSTGTEQNNANNYINRTLWGYFFFTDLNFVNTDTYKDFVRDAVNDGEYSIKSKEPPTGGSETLSTGLYCLVFPLSPHYVMTTDNGGITYQPRTLAFYEGYNFLKEQPSLVSIHISNIAPFTPYSNYINDGKMNVPSTFSPLELKTGVNLTYTTPDSQLLYNGTYLETIQCKTNDAGAITKRFTAINLLYFDAVIERKGTQISNALQVSTTISNAFAKSQIIEPKLYTKPYSNLTLKTLFSTAYEYDKLLLGTNYTPKVIDVPNPQNQKYFAYLDPSSTNSPYYTSLDTQIGLSGINVYQANTFIDNYAQFVADNKNYLLTGLGLPVAQGIASTVKGAVAGGIAGGPVGAVLGGVSGAVDVATTAIGFSARIDDLKASPESVKQAGNDIIHDLARKNNNMFITYSVDLLPEQKEQIFDYFFNYGYKVNKDCFWRNSTSSTDYNALFNRTRFNFIKTNDDVIHQRAIFRTDSPSAGSTINVSFEVRKKFEDILNEGTCIWNYYQSGTTYDNSNAKLFDTTFENKEYLI